MHLDTPVDESQALKSWPCFASLLSQLALVFFSETSLKTHVCAGFDRYTQTAEMFYQWNRKQSSNPLTSGWWRDERQWLNDTAAVRELWPARPQNQGQGVCVCLSFRYGLVGNRHTPTQSRSTHSDFYQRPRRYNQYTCVCFQSRENTSIFPALDSQAPNCCCR